MEDKKTIEEVQTLTTHIKRIYINDAWIKAFAKNYSGPCSGKKC